VAVFPEDMAGHFSPLMVEKLEERVRWKVRRPQLVEPMEFIGDSTLLHGIEDVGRVECSALVELLDAACVVVVEASGGHGIVAEKQERRPLCLKVGNRVLFTCQVTVEHSRLAALEYLLPPGARRVRNL